MYYSLHALSKQESVESERRIFLNLSASESGGVEEPY